MGFWSLVGWLMVFGCFLVVLKSFEISLKASILSTSWKIFLLLFVCFSFSRRLSFFFQSTQLARKAMVNPQKGSRSANFMQFPRGKQMTIYT